MWKIENTSDNTTNKFIAPVEGLISVTKPDSVQAFAYVNDAVSAVHHVHVKAGDTVYFRLKNTEDEPTSIKFDYAGETSEVLVPAGIEEEDTAIKEEVIMTPAETINLFSNPMGGNATGGAMGAGLGAGILGGVLGGALLGGRGLGGIGGAVGDVNGIVTPSLLASSLAQVTDTAMSTTVLQSLGDIKASVPLAEGQVQLALAGASADITRTVDNGVASLTLGQAMINKNVTDSIATALASQNAININVLQTGSAVKDAVTAYGTANLQATKDSQYATQVAISTSTKEILAALNDQNTASLNRQLAVAESALLEHRANSRSRDTEVNVTQTVNQNQAQLQAQSQQQQQFLITNNLLQAILSQAQVAQATNQNLIIGNSGASTTGAQTANPVNVRN